MTFTGELSCQRLRRSAVPEIWLNAHQNLIGSRDLTTPLSWFAILGLSLATVNLPTKFEVSNSTHYEDMKGGTKCRKWGGLG